MGHSQRTAATESYKSKLRPRKSDSKSESQSAKRVGVSTRSRSSLKGKRGATRSITTLGKAFKTRGKNTQMETQQKTAEVTHYLTETKKRQGRKRRQNNDLVPALDHPKRVKMGVLHKDIMPEHEGLQEKTTFEDLEIKKIWEVKFPTEVRAIAWDPEENCWWIRTDWGNKGLHKYSSTGEMIQKITNSVPTNNAGVCFDTKRSYLVVVDFTFGLLFYSSNNGKLVKKAKIPSVRGLFGVAYCPERDHYIVSEYYLHCLFFVDGESGKVKNKIGRQGHGDYEFNLPMSVYHTFNKSGCCCLVVADWMNDTVKYFTCDGELTSKISTKNLDCYSSQTSRPIMGSFNCGPAGACNDLLGNLYICDRGRRLLAMYKGNCHSEENCHIISTTREREPFCISCSSDGRFLALGTMQTPNGFMTVYSINQS